MTHTVHPYAFRIGFTRGWKSRWFSVRQYQELLRVDVLLREWLAAHLRRFAVSSIEIERSPTQLHVIVHTARPGLIIGRGGEGVERLRRQILAKLRGIKAGTSQAMKLSVEEVRAPETHAKLVAQLAADDLERRLPFRRVMKQIIEKVMANRKVGCVKIRLSGRLGGTEMGRREWLKRGRIPLQTLRADVDFAQERAHLPYGDIGVTVWIYKGEQASADIGAR